MYGGLSFCCNNMFFRFISSNSIPKYTESTDTFEELVCWSLESALLSYNQKSNEKYQILFLIHYLVYLLNLDFECSCLSQHEKFLQHYHDQDASKHESLVKDTSILVVEYVLMQPK